MASPRLDTLPIRAQAALAGANTSGVGLEIGPSYNPVAPKAAGFNVRILDHATRPELVVKYREAGLSQAELDRIEEVDYVWAGGPITNAIPADQRFDFIVAAHVIEHTTDVIGFLESASAMLTDDGVLSLIVPDKRFTFDRARPVSTAGQVVEAHLLPRTFHGPGAFIDTHLYSVRDHGDGMVWDAATDIDLNLAQCSWQAVRHTIGQVTRADYYIDIHRWVFTPASLELLLSDLHHLGYTDMAITSLHSTDSFEFFASLTRSPSLPDPEGAVAHPRRLELLTRIAREDPSFPTANPVRRAQAKVAQIRTGRSEARASRQNR
jgi:SAM-dependent methyltransferase